jgi:hypothetical protein
MTSIMSAFSRRFDREHAFGANAAERRPFLNRAGSDAERRASSGSRALRLYRNCASRRRKPKSRQARIDRCVNKRGASHPLPLPRLRSPGRIG